MEQSAFCILKGEFQDPRRRYQNPQMLKSVMWNVLVFLCNLCTPFCIVKSCLYGLECQIQCKGEVIDPYNVQFREKWQEIVCSLHIWLFKINFGMELGKSTCRVHAERDCLQFFFWYLELNIYFSAYLAGHITCWSIPLCTIALYQIWNVDIETCLSVPT